MTRKEAIEKLKEVLQEATETENSVCYITSDDAEWLKYCINSLETSTEYARQWRSREERE